MMFWNKSTGNICLLVVRTIFSRTQPVFILTFKYNKRFIFDVLLMDIFMEIIHRSCRNEVRAHHVMDAQHFLSYFSRFAIFLINISPVDLEPKAFSISSVTSLKNFDDRDSVGRIVLRRR